MSTRINLGLGKIALPIRFENEMKELRFRIYCGTQKIHGYGRGSTDPRIRTRLTFRAAPENGPGSTDTDAAYLQSCSQKGTPMHGYGRGLPSKLL